MICRLASTTVPKLLQLRPDVLTFLVGYIVGWMLSQLYTISVKYCKDACTYCVVCFLVSPFFLIFAPDDVSMCENKQKVLSYIRTKVHVDNKKLYKFRKLHLNFEVNSKQADNLQNS